MPFQRKTARLGILFSLKSALNVELLAAHILSDVPVRRFLTDFKQIYLSRRESKEEARGL